VLLLEWCYCIKVTRRSTSSLLAIVAGRVVDWAINNSVTFDDRMVTLFLDLDFVGLGILGVVQAALFAYQGGVDVEAAQVLRTVDSNLEVRIDSGHAPPGVLKLHTLGPRGGVKDDAVGNSY
jgi:hypothetical protein